MVAQSALREQPRRPVHCGEPPASCAPGDVPAEKQAQQESLGRIDSRRCFEMRPQFERRVGKARQRGLEHLHGIIAANLNGADDFPFAIAHRKFRKRRAVPSAHPLARPRVAKAEGV